MILIKTIKQPENDVGELELEDGEGGPDDPDAWRDICDDPTREDEE